MESGKFKFFERSEKRILVPACFDQEIYDECNFDSSCEMPTPIDGESSLKARLRKRAESIDNTSRLASFARLIIVCYHLPVVIRRTGIESSPFEVTWAESLIAKSAKDSITSSITVSWLGTVTLPGDGIPTAREQEELIEALRPLNCIPIFLEDNIKKLSYLGYCKDILWPLFHNVDQLDHIHAAWNIAHIAAAFQRRPSAAGASEEGRRAGAEALYSGSVYNPSDNEPVVDWQQKSQHFWPAYQTMNSAFIPVLSPMLRPGDVVWVHDYHLALLPKLLRDNNKVENVSVVYFSHIPFPTSQIFRSLPQASTILQSMVSADLVGFHSYDDARHFLIASKRMLGIPARTRVGGVLCLVQDSREVVVSMNHVSVEPDLIDAAVKHPDTIRYAAAIRARYPDKKIMVGVDACQRLNGLSLKFAGFEQMMNEKQIGNVVLIQKAIRTGARAADEATTSGDVNKMVKKINSVFSRLASKTSLQPSNVVDYEEVASLTLHERVALWLVADVFVLTAIREGLNLLPLEYIYARKNLGYAGVVVVSEFTACSSLLSGSLKINPFNTQSVADTMLKALTMKKDECCRRQQRDLPFLEAHPSAQWTREILSDLQYIRDSRALVQSFSGFPRPLNSIGLLTCYETIPASPTFPQFASRVFVFDYGGTLVQKESFNVYMKQATASFSIRGPNQSMMDTLRALSNDPRNEILIMTGVTRARLGNIFMGFPRITIATSNGLEHSWSSGLASDVLSQPIISRHHSLASDFEEGCGDGHEFVRSRRWDTLDYSHIDWGAVRDIAAPIMQRYTYRTNGAVISPRILSIGWSYFGADPEWGEVQAQQLQVELEAALAMHDVKIVSHITGVLEIVPKGLHKGVMLRSFISRVLAKRNAIYPSLITVCGNDLNDDKMFEEVLSMVSTARLTESNRLDQLQLFTVNVGVRETPAEFFVPTVQELETSLGALAMSTATAHLPGDCSSATA